jgi:negative regulator of sigma E activity
MRAQASPDLSPGFTERLAARLADEPMPIRRRAEPRGAEAEPAPAVVAATRS